MHFLKNGSGNFSDASLFGILAKCPTKAANQIRGDMLHLFKVIQIHRMRYIPFQRYMSVDQIIIQNKELLIPKIVLLSYIAHVCFSCMKRKCLVMI